jgi:L-cysteate sulfo-lyase
MKLSSLPRVRLANLPTPLQEAPNLTKALKGPRIFIKRDDMTGLAFGGNKTRKLEYLMADALRQKADYIVTGAGFHSNWCTQATAAARRLGLKIVLVKTGPKDGWVPEQLDGNHLLHVLMGAEIRVARPENISRVTKDTMDELTEAGHRPYLLTDAGSTPPGAAGYMNAMLELASQSVELGINIDYLVHATGSGGTQAGLVIGAKALNTGIKVIGVSVGARGVDEQREIVSKKIDEALEFQGLGIKIDSEDVIVNDGYAGGGYGFMSGGKAEAVRLAAETEGLMLDPVYTATAMSCLIDLCRKGFFKPSDVVVYLHTGGSAALFPYRDSFKAYLSSRDFPWTVPAWSPAHE